MATPTACHDLTFAQFTYIPQLAKSIHLVPSLTLKLDAKESDLPLEIGGYVARSSWMPSRRRRAVYASSSRYRQLCLSTSPRVVHSETCATTFARPSSARNIHGLWSQSPWPFFSAAA